MLWTRDKLWHFLASLAIVWIITAALLFGTKIWKSWKQASSTNQEIRQSANPNINIVDQQDERAENPQLHLCYAKMGTCKIIIAAAVLAFLVGLAKELADYVWDGWPWCKPVCHEDGWDILANSLGICAGICTMVCLRRLLSILELKRGTNSESRPRLDRQQNEDHDSNFAP